MPSSGAGLYYFRVHGLSAGGNSAGLGIRQNSEYMCYTYANSAGLESLACGAIMQLNEGLRISFVCQTENTNRNLKNNCFIF